MNVLLLAGTREARELASLLAAEPGVALVASLAGHTSQPVASPCPVRTGGFGGVDGLIHYLRANAVDVVVDATHAFARTMPHHAAEAARRSGVARLRLVRPPWERQAGDEWHDADDVDHAVRRLRELGAHRVLLTVGRLDLAPFAGLDARFVVRTIEAPDPMPLPGAEVVRARGPFTVDDELGLLLDGAIDALVTKNSGGHRAKLVAARRAGVPVVMVRRPPAVAGSWTATPADALAWLRARQA